jgi:DNA-binding MarR family transcriptional regulator
MRNESMRRGIREKVVEELVSTPPLFFRVIRRKLIRTMLSSIHEDITPLNFEIMRLLEKEGTMRVIEIGKTLQIAKAQMTQLIDKMVDINIIERETGTTDRRTTNIKLTDNGKNVLDKHRNHMVKAVRETLSSLTDEDLEDLLVSLKKLRYILSKLHE